MNIGFYAGSFDPFTNGHLHIVKSASFLFDKVFVGIGINQDKKVYFIIKNGILECEHTKSATLHNGESYCNIF